MKNLTESSQGNDKVNKLNIKKRLNEISEHKYGIKLLKKDCYS